MVHSPHLSTLSIEQLPIRNTFIHFHEPTVYDPLFDEKSAGKDGMRSAPPSMLASPFHTKWPEHEEKHIRGECKPCAYYLKKADSCRLGAQCGFCHLCPEGAMKARKKEKIRALKQQAAIAKQCANMMSDGGVTPCSSSGSTTPSEGDDGYYKHVRSSRHVHVHSALAHHSMPEWR